MALNRPSLYARLSTVMRILLVILLAGAAISKVASWRHSTAGKSEMYLIGYAIVILTELLLAACLVLRRTRAAASIIIAGGFVGASVATLIAMLSTDARGCRCLGNIDMTHGTALILQGVIVFLATASSYSAVPPSHMAVD